MKASLGKAIDVLLENARQLAGLGGQGGKLVQDQSRPRAGFVPEAGEERVPVRIGHLVEPWKKAGDLRRQARSLKGTLPLVTHVVDGSLRRQGLAQKSRLAAAPAAIQHGQGALLALHQPRQARGLFVAVEKR